MLQQHAHNASMLRSLFWQVQHDEGPGPYFHRVKTCEAHTASSACRDNLALTGCAAKSPGDLRIRWEADYATATSNGQAAPKIGSINVEAHLAARYW